MGAAPLPTTTSPAALDTCEPMPDESAARQQADRRRFTQSISHGRSLHARRLRRHRGGALHPGLHSGLTATRL